jgi:hypothetical protein
MLWLYARGGVITFIFWMVLIGVSLVICGLIAALIGSILLERKHKRDPVAYEEPHPGP